MQPENNLTCGFCNCVIVDADIERIVEHFKNNCINTFKVCTINHNHSIHEEYNGRIYNIKNLQSAPCLFNVDNEYVIICLPKLSRIDFIVFSPLESYKTKCQLEIINNNNTFSICADIHHNKMITLKHSSTSTMITKDRLNFTIRNKFIPNYREFIHTQNGPNTNTPGNWTPVL